MKMFSAWKGIGAFLRLNQAAVMYETVMLNSCPNNENLSDRINHVMVFMVESSTKHRLCDIYKA